MSSNKVINAVLALIEARPKDAREMLRSPEMRISGSDLQMRLANAILKREASAVIAELKAVLTDSLRIDPEQLKKLHPHWDELHIEAYLEGVATVEGLIDERISLADFRIAP